MKSKKEKLKNALGGFFAFAILSSAYSERLQALKDYVYSALAYYISQAAEYLGIPYDVFLLIIGITATYIALKLAEGSLKTMVIICWALIVILLIAKFLYGFSLSSILPG